MSHTCLTDHLEGAVGAGVDLAVANDTSCRRSMCGKPTSEETVRSVAMECSISVGVGERVASIAQSVALWLKLSISTCGCFRCDSSQSYILP